MTPADGSDPFVRLATRCGLEMSTVEVSTIPRDVLAPPADLEWHTLMTLARPGTDCAPIQTICVSDSADRRPPSIRDALWWLASDSWALDHVERDFRRWAATYNYSVDDPATARLFQLHLDRAMALAALLGDAAYSELLAVYTTQIGSEPRRTAPSPR
jgi:hypothetical protein